jgi:branched-chain amino acid transport system substrate-binding protein
MYDYAGSELHGSYFCDQWHPDIPNQKSHQFIESFLKRYKDRKNLGGVMSYDACMLLADAVRRADSFDRDRIRAALAHTKNFKGATGTIRFDSNRNPDKSAVILKFQDRTTVFVKTVEP